VTLFAYAFVGLYCLIGGLLIGSSMERWKWREKGIECGGRMHAGGYVYWVARADDKDACAALAERLKPEREARPCGARDVDANGAQVDQ
jgi:hypothetical protein